MAYGIAVEETKEVELYRYGRSKQVFRGPKPDLSKPYFAFIGGSEPFGKFVMHPFPSLVGQQVGRVCANFGTPGAGPGFFLKDPMILEACSNAVACVVQVMDVAPLSNRMYSVFPRRNMRLRGVSDTLKMLYPDVDFGKFRYVNTMLSKLKELDSTSYEVILAEQRSAWLARMLELLEDIESPKILLWLEASEGMRGAGSVTPEMVSVLEKHANSVVKIQLEDQQLHTRLNILNRDTGWMTREIHTEVAETVSQEFRAMQYS